MRILQTGSAAAVPPADTGPITPQATAQITVNLNRPQTTYKVVASAKASNEDAAKLQMFYAHLYLGLYYESEGDAKKAREHIDLAAGEFNGRDYMGAVARVHRDLLRKSDKAK